MRSTITSRGQTVIPAEIRSRFKLGPADRLEWLVEDGQIRVVPVREDPIAAFRAGGKGGGTARLLAGRQADREADRVGESRELLERAAELKAQHPLSLADAWIAACALLQGARLVHKDPEFQRLTLDQIVLPFKAGN